MAISSSPNKQRRLVRHSLGDGGSLFSKNCADYTSPATPCPAKLSIYDIQSTQLHRSGYQVSSPRPIVGLDAPSSGYPAVRAVPKNSCPAKQLARHASLATVAGWLICRSAGIFVASLFGCQTTLRSSISSPPAATTANAFSSPTTRFVWPLNVCIDAKNATAGMLLKSVGCPITYICSQRRSGNGKNPSRNFYGPGRVA